MADISKLRTMTGAGMMDCKNALNEAEGNFDKAIEIIRKKGQAIAAKRSDRQASEGCVLSASNGDFAAVVAIKCETDFVAQNADFIALTQSILDAAMANKVGLSYESPCHQWLPGSIRYPGYARFTLRHLSVESGS